MIPLSSPDITQKEKDAVLKVLETSTLSLGEQLQKFEAHMAGFAERKYAIAVNSGTAGLHVIVRALNIQEGDEVITTPFSFIASANCMLYEKAKPVFVDIDEQTLQIDPAKIEAAITPKTKAILVVDVFGHPANWDAIEEITKKHNLMLIEDSAEAVGSLYKEKKCGSFGAASIFSFYPNKQMTTGEGGVVLTDREDIANACKSMVNQGRKVENGKWLEHVQLGYNYRLPEIQCALGISQLERIEEILEKRDKVAHMYMQKLKEFPEVEVPFIAPYAKMSWFVYVIRLNKSYSRQQRDALMQYMEDHGVECRGYFESIHLQPFYKKTFGYKEGDFPISEEISDRTIALPFYNNITEEQIDTVVTTLKNGLKTIV